MASRVDGPRNSRACAGSRRACIADCHRMAWFGRDLRGHIRKPLSEHDEHVGSAVNDRIAVLGGGMLGVCTALELAHRGRDVTLLEGAADVMQGASRWNEGKIHLGFLYAADASM